MRRRPSVWIRTQRLAATVGDPLEDCDEDARLSQQLEIIAAEQGVPIAALLAEAEAAVARWEATGPITRESVIEHVATEHGVDPDAVRMELAAMGLRCKG